MSTELMTNKPQKVFFKNLEIFLDAITGENQIKWEFNVNENTFDVYFSGEVTLNEVREAKEIIFNYFPTKSFSEELARADFVNVIRVRL